ncbi:MAG TPA: fibronectin type III domain-containing protein [Patescibacteria group bacterium]|nr:fibronectin type III domain-containing protein [Patescibacteria group bacterium]
MKLNTRPLSVCSGHGKAAILCWLFWSSYSMANDMTWLYAVQLSAGIQTDPPQISLHWEPDQFGADSYVVYRKLKTDAVWGPGTMLPGSATGFSDSNVSVGSAYEYQVIKHASLGYTGFGYIYAGINAPLIENRGTVLLIVAADTGSLGNELSRLQVDLVGDGWFVVRHDISPDDSPASVKQLILNDYNADPDHVQAVFLFGHVPIVMSGDLDYDSHGARALPADGFYGDTSGDWNLQSDPTNRPSYFPAEIKLMIGRVDFFDMPGVGASPSWPSETELLRRYLDKDHAWRHKLVVVPRRALMANRVGDFDGQAYAASGYRNFETFVGPGNIVEADVSDTAPPDQRWISLASTNAWLWSYACGGGQDAIISQLGTHGAFNDVWSTDIVGQDAHVVFSMFFGSHFGDWTRTDNIMRSVLATPGVGLTACIVGLPHWFCHHMAMGEPIGYAARLTMNNTTLYQNQSNALPRAVFINLLGDPTLRMEPVAPPTNLSAATAAGTVTLNWSASADSTAGYAIYRSTSGNGPFTRLSPTLVTQTSYTDSNALSTSGATYMVRAVALQNNPSGSYFNPSEGIFVQPGAVSTVVAPVVSASIKPPGLEVSWNSQNNVVYFLQVKSGLAETWTNLSGPITATSSVTTFIDTSSPSYQTRLYRVLAQ